MVGIQENVSGEAGQPAPQGGVAAKAALGSLALALGGALLVPHSGKLAFLCFALAGLLPVLGGFRQADDSGNAQAPGRRQPRRPWELAFMAVLLGLAWYTRFHNLESIPAGAITYEGETCSDLKGLRQAPFTPHSTHPVNRWPTLMHYQAIFFGDVLGENLGSYRLVPALWSFFGLILFYFLMRRLASPGVAALSTLFYVSSYLDLTMSHRLFPGTLLFLPVLGGLLCILKAVEDKSLAWVVLGGLVAGLSLHGFYPGRGVPFLFFGYLAWSRLVAKDRALGWGSQIAFWAAFAAVAAPVALWALKNWEFYWGWIQQVNPNKNAGASGYLGMLWKNLPAYAGLFQVRGDSHWEDNVRLLPLMDPFCGALFAAAFFYVSFTLLRPVHAFAFALLWAGMLPSMLGDSDHPGTRRMIMAVPAFYMMIGLYLERLRTALWPSRGPLFRALAIAVLLGGAGYSIRHGVKHAFVDFFSNPDSLKRFSHNAWLANREIRKNPGYQVYLNQGLSNQYVHDAFYPYGTRNLGNIEEIFALEPGKDYLMILNPFVARLFPALEALFPGSEASTFPYPGEASDGLDDPFGPPIYLATLKVPSSAVDASHQLFHTLSPTARVSWNKPEFGQSLGGQELDLSGALVASEQRGLEGLLSVDWPGFTIQVDGKAVKAGAPHFVSSGVHSLRIKGKVPPGGAALPLKWLVQGRDYAPWRVLCLDATRAITAEFTQGALSWGKGKPDLTRREILPLRRYWDPLELNHPFSVRYKAVFKAPQAGEYQVRTFGPHIQCQIRLQGRVVFDTLNPGQPPLLASAKLEAGRPVSLEFDYAPHIMFHLRTPILQLKGPGDAEFKEFPMALVQP